MKSFGRAAVVLGLAILGCATAVGQAKLGLHVVDGNGQKVGYVLDTSNAVIFISGEAFVMEAGQSGFRAAAFSVFSETVDCSTQFVQMYAGQSFGLLTQAWYTSDGLFHYPDTSQVQVLPVLSTRSIGDDGVPGPCGATTGLIYAAPVLTAAAPVLALPLTVVDALAVSPAPPTATFNDVPTNHPFFKYIEALAASGITGGCGSGNYCPDNPVTRGQMAVFLAKALGL